MVLLVFEDVLIVEVTLVTGVTSDSGVLYVGFWLVDIDYCDDIT